MVFDSVGQRETAMLRITVEEFEYELESKGTYRNEVKKRQLVELVAEPGEALAQLSCVLGSCELKARS